MSLFNGIKWPYATMQQLNLDWILTEIKRVMGFFPEDGNAGEILMKKEEGAAWEPLEAVDININALPEDTELSDNDKLVFYDISASANRKITAPNLLNSMMSNGSPLMDGTASAGTSKKPARYDHRHPTDTSRQAALSGAQMAAVNSGATANAFQNGVLKPEHGGTGATTAQGAIDWLGIYTAEELVYTITPVSGISIRGFSMRKMGKIAFGTLYFDVTSAISAGADMATLDSDLPNPVGSYTVASVCDSSGTSGMVYITKGASNKIKAWSKLSAGTHYYAQFVYLIA